jgi:hypothetical protein
MKLPPTVQTPKLQTQSSSVDESGFRPQVTVLLGMIHGSVEDQRRENMGVVGGSDTYTS